MMSFINMHKGPEGPCECQNGKSCLIPIVMKILTKVKCGSIARLSRIKSGARL